MQKLIFRNGNGVEVDFTSGDFGIVNWTGFSEADLNIQTQQVPFNDGSVYLDSLIQDRVISITLAINDEKNLEKRYTLRREIIALMNPKLGMGELIYENDIFRRKISCLPKLPTFPTKNFNDSGTVKASLSFHCPSPYWEDVEETVVEFDLIKQPQIVNSGDIETPVKIEISGVNCKNPEIKNFNTNKKIKYKGELNELLLIDTNLGNKTAKIENRGWDYKPYSDKIFYRGYSDGSELFTTTASSLVYELKDFKLNPIFSMSNFFRDNLEEGTNLITSRISYLKDSFWCSLCSYKLNDSRFVRIYSSTNFKDWKIETQFSIPKSLSFSSIGYVEKTQKYYFYEADNFQFYISDDLVNWTNHKVIGVEYPDEVYQVLNYYQDTYFVVTKYGYIYTTKDFETWTKLDTRLDLHNSNYISIKNILCFNDKVVIHYGQYLVKSLDLLNWNNVTDLLEKFNSLTYNDITEEWFIYGYDSGNYFILYSPNLVNFEKYPTDYLLSYEGGGVYLKHSGLYVNSENYKGLYFSLDGIHPMENSYKNVWGFQTTTKLDYLKTINEVVIYSEDLITDTDTKVLFDPPFSFEAIVEDENNMYLVQVITDWDKKTTKISFHKTNFVDTEKVGEFNLDFYANITNFSFIPEKNLFTSFVGDYDTGNLFILTSHNLQDWEKFPIDKQSTGIIGDSKFYYVKSKDYFVFNNFENFCITKDFVNWGEPIYLTNYRCSDNVSSNGSDFYIMCNTDDKGMSIPPVLLKTNDFVNFEYFNFPDLSQSDSIKIIYNEYQKCFYIFGPNRYYKFSDPYNMLKIEYLGDIKPSVSKGLEFYSYMLYVFTKQSESNAIDKISEDSNMNFTLKKGENRIRFNCESGNATVKLTYTNKYLGV